MLFRRTAPDGRAGKGDKRVWERWGEAEMRSRGVMKFAVACGLLVPEMVALSRLNRQIVSSNWRRNPPPVRRFSGSGIFPWFASRLVRRDHLASSVPVVSCVVIFTLLLFALSTPVCLNFAAHGPLRLIFEVSGFHGLSEVIRASGIPFREQIPRNSASQNVPNLYLNLPTYLLRCFCSLWLRFAVSSWFFLVRLAKICAEKKSSLRRYLMLFQNILIDSFHDLLSVLCVLLFLFVLPEIR